MAKKPSVNIVIPVYNEEAELSSSVKTLSDYLKDNLEDFNWTITIADNASTDRTLAIANSLSKKKFSCAGVASQTKRQRQGSQESVD
jgi:glycosyltransferase involved in cell wall biosynthesis